MKATRPSFTLSHTAAHTGVPSSGALSTISWHQPRCLLADPREEYIVQAAVASLSQHSLSVWGHTHKSVYTKV